MKIFSILCAIEFSLGSKIGQNLPEPEQNFSEVGQNRFEIEQNFPDIGQNRLEIGHILPKVGLSNINNSVQLIADGSSNRFFISDYTLSINLIPFLLLLKVAFILGE